MIWFNIRLSSVSIPRHMTTVTWAEVSRGSFCNRARRSRTVSREHSSSQLAAVCVCEKKGRISELQTGLEDYLLNKSAKQHIWWVYIWSIAFLIPCPTAAADSALTMCMRKSLESVAPSVLWIRSSLIDPTRICSPPTIRRRSCVVAMWGCEEKMWE